MRSLVAGTAGLLVAVAAACGPDSGRHEPLPQLAIEEPVTVSGLSSGAFFAHQFHVAYSDLVNGAAVLAGGPYRCASQVPAALVAHPTPRIATATAVCTHVARDAFGLYGSFLPQAPDADAATRAIDEAWRDGVIADPANIGDDRVWLFHGGRDGIVPEGSVDAVTQVYRALGVGGERLASERLRSAAHGFPVEDVRDTPFGERSCEATGRPYLIDCDFDAAGALLRHLFGALQAPVAPVRAHLATFDQTPFFDTGEESVSLADHGFVYVPEDCAGAETACRLHVAFHGCGQGAAFVEDAFVRGAGYNGWAEANRIVVLYPQTAAWTDPLDPSGLTANPQGCWDWWGYSDPDYATRTAPQMRAVREMVAALAEP